VGFLVAVVVSTVFFWAVTILIVVAMLGILGAVLFRRRRGADTNRGLTT
jgi:hypothetical protein